MHHRSSTKYVHPIQNGNTETRVLNYILFFLHTNRLRKTVPIEVKWRLRLTRACALASQQSFLIPFQNHSDQSRVKHATVHIEKNCHETFVAALFCFFFCYLAIT